MSQEEALCQSLHQEHLPSIRGEPYRAELHRLGDKHVIRSGLQDNELLCGWANGWAQSGSHAARDGNSWKITAERIVSSEIRGKHAACEKSGSKQVQPSRRWGSDSIVNLQGAKAIRKDRGGGVDFHAEVQLTRVIGYAPCKLHAACAICIILVKYWWASQIITRLLISKPSSIATAPTSCSIKIASKRLTSLALKSPTSWRHCSRPMTRSCELCSRKSKRCVAKTIRYSVKTRSFDQKSKHTKVVFSRKKKSSRLC